jgi:cell division protein FtsX
VHLKSGSLYPILVRLADPDELDNAVNQLRGCDAGLTMNVIPLAHVFHAIQSLVNSTRLLLGCIAFVALLVAGAGVSNTILMAVTERGREIGVLRSAIELLAKTSFDWFGSKPFRFALAEQSWESRSRFLPQGAWKCG